MLINTIPHTRPPAGLTGWPLPLAQTLGGQRARAISVCWRKSWGSVRDEEGLKGEARSDGLV